LLKNCLEEKRQDPLGEAPHHEVVDQVRRYETGLPLDRDGRFPPAAGPGEALQLDPMGRGDLGIGVKRWPGIKGKYERPNGDGWKNRRTRGDVVQRPDALTGVEGEADFLGGLSDGGRDQIDIGGGRLTPRQPYVAGPGIAEALGPTDEEQRIGLGHQHQGDPGPDQAGGIG
jgi:hypothetical protein